MMPSVTAVNDAYSVHQGGTIDISAPGILSNDTTNNGPLTASLVSGPSHASTASVGSTGRLFYRLAAGSVGSGGVLVPAYVGTDSLVYKATDHGGATSNATVNLTITDTPPTVSNTTLNYAVATNSSLSVSASSGLLTASVAADADGDTVIPVHPNGSGGYAAWQAGVSTSTAHGQLWVSNNGQFTYTPTTGYSGWDSFQFAVWDFADGGFSSQVTVYINVGSVAAASTSTGITSGTNPSVHGQPVTFTATVTSSVGTPTGSVSFLDGTTLLGTGTLSSGVATFTTSALSTASHTINADYAGTTVFAASSGSVSQTVNQASTSTTVDWASSYSSPTVYGQGVKFKATVTAVSPGSGTVTGNVSFYDGATLLETDALVSGVATTSLITTLGAGNHTITASYASTTDFSGSTSSGITHVVNQDSTTTTLTSSENPSFFGDNVTFTATVTSTVGTTPTGTVNFTDNGVSLGSGTLNGSGVATLTTADLAVGTHPITATYPSTTNYLGSSSTPTLDQLVWDTNSSLSTSSDVLYSGAFVYGIPLDLDQSPGRDVGSEPGLVYNSATVDPTPIVQTQVSLISSEGAPSSVTATLYWNGSYAGSNTLSGSGVDPSEPITIDVEGPADEPTGVYPYSVTVAVNYSNSAYDLSATSTGNGIVVNQDDSPFGAGWNLSYYQSLFSVSGGGVLQVFGNGEGYYYPSGGGATSAPPVDPVQYDYGDVELDNVSGTLSGSTLTASTGDVYTFSGGALVNWSQPGGLNQFTFTGSTSGPSTETTPDGASTTFSGSSIVTTTGGGSMTSTLSQSGGNLTQFTDPTGLTYDFTYDSDGRLTGITDGAQVIAITYTDGMVSQVSAGDPITTTFVPALSEGLTSLGSGAPTGKATDGLGNSASVTFNAKGSASSSIDGNGHTTHYAYDSNGYLALMTDALGNSTTYTNDSVGYVTGVQYPDGSRTTTTYDSNHNVLTQTDQLGHTTTSTYNSKNEKTTMTDPLGNVTTYTYTSAGDLQTTTDPLGNVSTNVYDADRRLEATITPLGERTTYTYDSSGNQATVTDPLGHITTTTYDAAGRLLTSTTPTGATTTYVYDSAGNQSGQIDPNGNRTSYVYDSRGLEVNEIDGVGSGVQRTTTMVYDDAGRLVANVDARGNATSYVYDAAGNQTEVIDALGNITTTVYDADNRAIATIDPLGHRTTTTYDADGRAIATIDALGNRTTTAYDAAGDVVAVTDANNHTTTTVYDANNRPIATIDALGNRATTIYDAAGNATETIDAWGNITTSLYDADNRQIATIDALGNRTTTAYDAAGNVVAVTDANNHTTTNVYDAGNRQIATIDALGNRTTTAYDAAGNVVNTIDPRGDVTTYSYDADNRQVNTIDALGNKTTTAYDAVGNVVNQIDALGDKTTYVFDADNRQIATIDPLGNRSTTAYDAAGNVVVVTDANDHTTSYLFDADNRQIAMVDPLGNRTTTAYDAVGNVVNTVDPRGDVTTYIYNADNRQVNTIDGAGDKTTMIYDAAGNVVNSIDGRGEVTTYIYDSDNRLVNTIDANSHKTTTVYDAIGNVVNTIDGAGDKTTSVYDADNRVVKSIDADGNVTSYAYDAAGNQTKVVDPDSNITTFVYDADNRETSEVNPVGYTSYLAYDAAGRLVSKIDDLGQQVTMSYDAANRETGETWFNDGGIQVSQLTYSYDAVGNMLTAADGNGAYTFTYDADDRLLAQQDMFGTTATYSYDAASNMTGIVDSLGGTQTMVYDAANRETVVQFTGNSQALNEGIAYNADSQPFSISRFSDAAGTTLVGSTNYAYNPTGQVTNIHHLNSSGGNVTNVTYTYDAANNLSTETRDSATTSYSYDAAGQMTGNGSTTYAYDANGSRNNGSYTVGANNEIASDGTWTYYYDANGNLIEKTQGVSAETWYYTYNNRNQMTSAMQYTAPGGTLLETVNYKYDVFGDLITESVTASGTTTTTNTAFRIVNPSPGIVHDVNQALADLNTSDALLTRYLFDNLSTSPIAYLNSGGVVWLLKDNLGSTIVAMNNSGTVLATATYDAFGNMTVLSGTGSSLGVILFAGYRFDAEAGLLAAHWRWYNPETEQWTTVDPIGFAAGDPDTRRYVANDATTYADSSGLRPTSSPSCFCPPSSNGVPVPIAERNVTFGGVKVSLYNYTRSDGDAVAEYAWKVKTDIASAMRVLPTYNTDPIIKQEVDRWFLNNNYNKQLANTLNKTILPIIERFPFADEMKRAVQPAGCSATSQAGLAAAFDWQWFHPRSSVRRDP